MKIRNSVGINSNHPNYSKVTGNNRPVKTNADVTFGMKLTTLPKLFGGVALMTMYIMPSFAQTSKQVALLKQFAADETRELNKCINGSPGCSYPGGEWKHFAGCSSLSYRGFNYADLNSELNSQPELAKFVKKIDKDADEILEFHPNAKGLRTIKRPLSKDPKENIATIKKVINTAQKELGTSVFPMIEIGYQSDLDNIENSFFKLGKKYAKFYWNDESFLKNLRTMYADTIRKEVFKNNVSRNIFIGFFKR